MRSARAYWDLVCPEGKQHPNEQKSRDVVDEPHPSPVATFCALSIGRMHPSATVGRYCEKEPPEKTMRWESPPIHAAG